MKIETTITGSSVVLVAIRRHDVLKLYTRKIKKND